MRNIHSFRGSNIVKLFLSPFWKGVYSPKVNKFFLFRVDPAFQKGTDLLVSKQEVTKVVSLV